MKKNLTLTMSDSENSDASITWEDFFGTSTDLVPTLLGMYDALLEGISEPNELQKRLSANVSSRVAQRTASPSVLKQCLISTSTNGSVANSNQLCDSKKHLSNSIINLSPNVQRILSHLNETNKLCASETVNEQINYTQTTQINKLRVTNGYQYSKVDFIKSTAFTNISNLKSKKYNIVTKDSEMDDSSKKMISEDSICHTAFQSEAEAIPTIDVAQRHSENDNLERCEVKTCGLLQVPRPLSMSSIASSSSNSSVSSSVANKSGANAYLASIESLDDDSDCDKRNGSRQKNSNDSDKPNSEIDDRRPRIVQITPISRPRYCDPQLSPVERVLLEIVDTEAVYVSDLQEVIRGYLNEWVQDEDCPLFEHLPDLFSNIKEIYDFNSKFLNQLRDCGLDPVNVSKTFVQNNGGFEIYTQYCTNYPKTMSVLTELMSNDVTAKMFRDKQSILGHSLPLGSYLLKPVQRILKYHLLLQNLVKQCDAKDVNDIELALSTMTGIAKHINNMKRKHEHAVRVQEIQSLLYGWHGEDLTTFGELCAEGTFRMHGAKAQRQAFLFDKMLLLTKNKEDGILNYKTHIMCSNLMLIESVQGEPLSFHVIPFDNPRMQCTLQARNLEQKREWTLQLKRVILENYNAVIPSHARQLVMELGQNKIEDETLTDKSTFYKKQYSAPEYLQRRKLDRERRKSETGLRNRLKKPRKSDSALVNDIDLTDDICKSDGSPGATPRRNARRSESQTRERSKSRDPFAKFGSWRRKSEPGTEINFFSSPPAANISLEDSPKFNEDLTSPESTLDFRIPQYNTKTIPKKIYKLKKARNKCKGSTFYTELSDMSNCDEILHISESNDSINTINDSNTPNKHENQSMSTPEVNQDVVEEQKDRIETVEDIVSQLLMQNREFQKIFKKQKKHINLRNRLNKTPTFLPKNLSDNNESSDSECEITTQGKDEDIYETLSNNENIKNNSLIEKASKIHIKANNLMDNNLVKSINEKSPIKSDDSDYVVLTYNNGQLKTYKNNIHESNSPENKNNIEKKKPKLNLKDDPNLLKNETNQTKLTTFQNNIYNISRKTNSSKDNKTTWYSSDMHKYISCPNNPEIWLKQQTEHLATPHSKKACSLPRSFELLNEQQLNNSDIKYFTREGKLMHVDRPLTIASDSTNDIELNDIENFILENNDQSFPENKTVFLKNESSLYRRQSEQNSLYSEPIYQTPGNSINTSSTADLNSSNIHPEYKIYRPTINLSSFKNVLSKTSRSNKQNLTDMSDDCSNEKERRQPSTIVRNYSRSLLQRFKSIISEENPYLEEKSNILSGKENSEECTEETHFPKKPLDKPKISKPEIKYSKVDLLTVPAFNTKVSQKLPIYKQGSKSLGARIAQSDYAVPGEIFTELTPENTLINKYSLRPDSLLSNSSHFTSSSDGCQCDQANTNDSCCNCEKKSNPSDCFYEKNFEETEKIMESEIFRDSAVYSDHDDNNKHAVNVELKEITNNGVMEKNGKSINKIEEKTNVMQNTSTPKVKNAKIELNKTSTPRKQIKRPTKLPPPIPIKPDLGKMIQTSSKDKSIGEHSASKSETNKCDISKENQISQENPRSESKEIVDTGKHKIAVQTQNELKTLINVDSIKTDTSISHSKTISSNKKIQITKTVTPKFQKYSTPQKFQETRTTRSDLTKKESKIPVGKNSLSTSSYTKYNIQKLSQNHDSASVTEIIETVSVTTASPASKGWVKHVVDKFQ